LIISGGLNIQPEEIEAVAMASPGVSDVAAFGVPSDRWGREVRLAVVPADNFDEAALRAYLRSNLDRYKLPKAVHIVEHLPRTPVGKVQRFRLATQFAPSTATDREDDRSTEQDSGGTSHHIS
jgi:acyl-CoA synthetase (AMP-forming)/AMP-acid ligase II